MLREAATVPKVRRPTRPTKGSKRSRLAEKRQKSATKAGAKKVTVRLNDRHREILRKVKDSGMTGYVAVIKTEVRSLEGLRDKKLLKRGAKDKATGHHPYSFTKSGEKHLGSSAGSTGGPA